MNAALEKVVQCLDLKEVGRDEWEGDDPDPEVGHPEKTPGSRSFRAFRVVAGPDQTDCIRRGIRSS